MTSNLTSIPMEARSLLRQAPCPECGKPGYGSDTGSCAWCDQRDKACQAILDMPADETAGVQVAGDTLPTALWQFEQRASVLLSDEQAKASPDNALVGFICDAVRLARENAKMATGLGAVIERERSAVEPSVRKAEHFDIFPAEGCSRCPWNVGDLHNRDCGYPDCSPAWKPNDDPNGWRPIHTAPKNGRFQVALEGIPEHAWPAYRTDGGSIYSNAHGILNSKVHGRLTVATHWRPSQPAPFQPDFFRYPHHPRSRG